MTDPPRRYKTIEELSVEEHVQRMQALKRGETEPRFERAEYREARRRLLRDAGFEDEGERQQQSPTRPAPRPRQRELPVGRKR